MTSKIYLVVCACVGFAVHSTLAQLRGSLGTTYLADRLDVTYGSFSSLPTTESSAISAGWSLVDSDCTYGKRYQLNGDYAVTVLFNADGVAAGVQASVASIDQTSWASFPDIVEEIDGLYAVTVYFQDPSTICTSSNRLLTTQFGDSLLLRKSDGTTENLPLNSNDLTIGAPDWVLATCFIGMGTHYWKNTTVDMDCNYLFPVAIMYTQDTLRTFLFALLSTTGALESSSRWEHPPQSALQQFFYPGDEPQCLLGSSIAMSTMHFFVQNPIWNTCLF